MNIGNILFPTDFSESASHALPYVTSMASRFDSRVTVLHVRLPYADDPNRPQYLFFNEDRYSEYVKAQLQTIEDRLKLDQPVNTVFARGTSPAIGILNHLAQNTVDLLIMGTHGRSALGRFLLGSVAEKVVRHARNPVLTIAGAEGDYRNSPEFKKILAPTDFSEHSLNAVEYASALAREFHADLEVLYVVTRSAQPSPYGASEIEKETDLEELAGRAKKELGSILTERGLKAFTSRVDIGKSGSGASEAIVEFARKMPIDLVVMAAHGLTGTEHALMGSTTERVVRTAPCPVLTFHKEGA